MDLGQMTSGDAGAGAFTLLLPLGSTEQHGPHLPLDTDTRIAVAVSTKASALVAGVVVAPPIGIGAAGEHQGFGGTLSIGTEVLTSVIVEIVRTAGPEFVRLVVVNAHGGNAAAVAQAVAICQQESRPLQAWHARLKGADAHAGLAETSVMLALAPESVRMELAERGVTAPMSEMIDDLRARGVMAVSPNGVLGDPTGATAEQGCQIFDQWVAEVCQLLQR